MSAALQHLDLDIYEDMWEPPKSLIDKRKLKGTPQHGIGRSCKAGKEEIIGLLTALRLFAVEGDAVRHKRWMAVLKSIVSELQGLKKVSAVIQGATDVQTIPTLVITCSAADRVIKALIAGKPSIHVDPCLRAENKLVVNPICIPQDKPLLIGRTLKSVISRLT